MGGIDGVNEAEILEKATNNLVRELYNKLPTALEAVDSEMYQEDVEMVEILGPSHGPFSTPKPRKWAIGHLPSLEQLQLADYPYVSGWARILDPRDDQAGWTPAQGRMLVQAFVIAADSTSVARAAYRYAAAIQKSIKGTTLGGLCDPVENIGYIDMGLVLRREFGEDASHDPWFVQPIVYDFRADFIIL